MPLHVSDIVTVTTCWQNETKSTRAAHLFLLHVLIIIRIACEDESKTAIYVYTYTKSLNTSCVLEILSDYCTKPVERLISRVKLLKLSMIPDNVQQMEYSIISSICRIFKLAAPVKPFWLITHKAVTSLKFGESPSILFNLLLLCVILISWDLKSKIPQENKQEVK